MFKRSGRAPRYVGHYIKIVFVLLLLVNCPFSSIGGGGTSKVGRLPSAYKVGRKECHSATSHRIYLPQKGRLLVTFYRVPVIPICRITSLYASTTKLIYGLLEMCHLRLWKINRYSQAINHYRTYLQLL